MRTFSIRPLQEDIKNQIKTTNEILEVIESLSRLEKALDNNEDKKELDLLLKKLGSASNTLLDNVERTSKFIREVSS